MPMKAVDIFSKIRKESMSFGKAVIFIKASSYGINDLLPEEYFIMLVLFIKEGIWTQRE